MRNSNNTAQCKERLQRESIYSTYYRLSCIYFLSDKYSQILLSHGGEVKFDHNPSGVFFAGQVNFNEHQFSLFKIIRKFVMFFRHFQVSWN